jgi:peptidoglycan/xylan/chitin deacetylase (PgdA/CDA1 family)
MADRLQPYHDRDFTTANLAGAYRQLLAMLARHDIRATFAFVMAFTLTAKERERFPVLDPRRNRDDNWLRHYWQDLEAGHVDGWHCPEALDLVREFGAHEIASHSFCHRPLGDASIDADGAAQELAYADEAAKLKKVELRTLVFPRNDVGNLRAVRSAGYLGYRSRLPRQGGRRGQAMALLEEFAVRRRPQVALDEREKLVAIPSGYFFNWRFGLRRLVPPRVTEMRWRNMLNRCTRDGGVVHMWLHPHNLITAPTTAPVLSPVLAEVARLREQGKIDVLTQREYCERRLGAKRS